MKCNESLTTSTRADVEPPAAPSAAGSIPPEASAFFMSMLANVVFKPLAESMGTLGDTVVGTVTQELARRNAQSGTHIL